MTNSLCSLFHQIDVIWIILMQQERGIKSSHRIIHSRKQLFEGRPGYAYR